MLFNILPNFCTMDISKPWIQYTQTHVRSRAACLYLDFTITVFINHVRYYGNIKITCCEVRVCISLTKTLILY